VGEWSYSSAILVLGARWRCDELHAPAALPPKERSPGTHWLGGRVGPRVGLDAVEKREKSCTAGNQTRAVLRSVGRLPDNGRRHITQDPNLNYDIFF
jgi:hypothetical protein